MKSFPSHSSEKSKDKIYKIIGVVVFVLFNISILYYSKKYGIATNADTTEPEITDEAVTTVDPKKVKPVTKPGKNPPKDFRAEDNQPEEPTIDPSDIKIPKPNPPIVSPPVLSSSLVLKLMDDKVTWRNTGSMGYRITIKRSADEKVVFTKETKDTFIGYSQMNLFDSKRYSLNVECIEKEFEETKNFSLVNKGQSLSPTCK
jgi:hypothetical protein